MPSDAPPPMPPGFPGMLGAGMDGGDEEPGAGRQVLETGLLVLSLACVWPLVFGYDHWIWYALAGVSGLTLTVLLVRRIARMRKTYGRVTLPGARPLPPGTPQGRRLSAPAEGASPARNSLDKS
ncbi:MAG: hypothetical protein KIS92_20720 [Planctomycetota bacterium]|nr:hypothetical protein [Planctomycetota bacterium]